MNLRTPIRVLELLRSTIEKYNTFGIRIAHDWDYLHGSYFSRAIAGFAFTGRTVDADQLCEVASVGQCVRNRVAIRREAVCSDWNLVLAVACRIPPQAICGALVALARDDVENQIGMPLDSNEHVPVTEILVIFEPDSFLLLANPTPQFVQFYIAYLNVAKSCGHDAFALLTSQHQEFQNRLLVNASQTDHARNAVSFEQELKDKFGLLDRQIHAIQGVVASVREYLPALGALVTLAIGAFTKLPAFGTATMAECGLRLLRSKPIMGLGSALRLTPVLISPWR